MKKRYVVTFLKRIADDQGHEKDVRQHQVDVCAASKEEAFEEAQADFCRRHELPDWSFHADRYQVEEPEFPS